MTGTTPSNKTPLRHVVFRILKGQYMIMMFAVFGTGILLGHLITPFLILYDKLAGHEPLRNQRVYRGFVILWLWLMEKGGLLKTLPHRGKIMDGPCVVIANHPGLFDVLVLIRDVPKMSLIAKQPLRTRLGMGYLFKLAGWIFATSNANASMAMETTNKAVDVLKKGYKFMLFPEGTRSPKAGLLRFKSGAFKLARLAGVPIQPVLIRNTPPFLPHEDRWYYPPYETSLLQLEFLEPIPPPKEKEERRAAAIVESMFRTALGVEH
jgi:1-acyl-sn-glycerol-3-phosphate acyltransferase